MFWLNILLFLFLWLIQPKSLKIVLVNSPLKLLSHGFCSCHVYQNIEKLVGVNSCHIFEIYICHL